ncbi:hypothetical protein COPCOM_03441 [Coprococcus comes ATCC 27758]|uniref:Uncharacterized protein n=1 Tax=Coprococcus comes ATCC 27758 TaxID=470146 RepID=C0BE29_9FIRM|nr:hypothetical protein COPCOM_03441 [Coprococcus comes ATCC 27758]
MQTAIAENSRTALDQNEYERRYADLAERYNTIKSEYDKISEQIESKKAQRELFKVFIRALEKQGALLEEFDEGLWSSLVQEVVVNAKDDIRFIFKNGFEIKRDNELNDKIQDWKDKGVFANFIMNLQDLDGKQTGFLEELWDVRLDEIEVETDKSCKVIFSDGIEVIT